MIIIEVCAQSYRAALHAAAGGAHRIELCTHLAGGGITPSLGLVHQVLHEISIPVFVLIRPRPGNFYYSPGEIAIMEQDIRYVVEIGVQGIVAGCLTSDDQVDIPSTLRLLNASQGLPFTFHRAFELVKAPLKALNQLMEIGVDRILTGGITGHAFDNRLELKALQLQAGSRLTILAGSGVTPSNVHQLLLDSQVREVHSSAKYGKQISTTLNEDPLDSDPEVVRQLVKICAAYTPLDL